MSERDAARAMPMVRITKPIGITLANMAYNMKRWRWLDGRSLPA